MAVLLPSTLHTHIFKENEGATSSLQFFIMIITIIYSSLNSGKVTIGILLELHTEWQHAVGFKRGEWGGRLGA